ncbi:MAG: NAD(+)/NADH kinase [Balneolaceae bacterium]
MKLAIIAHTDRYTVKPYLMSVLSWCEENLSSGLVTRSLYELATKRYCDTMTILDSEQAAVESADLVVAIGGDGTMLHATQLTLGLDKDILGINCGRLGFMANIQLEQISDALDAALKQNYLLDERSMLKATVNGSQTHHALNEFLFTKKDTTSLITITAQYNQMLVNRYWADGILVSTPTGSTAYNLSSGGPIVMPGTPVMTLTPINPHTLTTRPLVLPSDKVLTITVEEEPEHILLSRDGTIIDINSGPVTVEIQRSEHTIKLIQLPGQNYFDTLRTKLMWGLDSRKKR